MAFNLGKVVNQSEANPFKEGNARRYEPEGCGFISREISVQAYLYEHHCVELIHHVSVSSIMPCVFMWQMNPKI